MIYYLGGPDDFSLRLAVQRLLHGALPADTADLNLTRLSGTEVTLDALRFACEAAPFLADRRAVVVDGAFARAAKRESARAAAPARRETPKRDASLVADIAAYLPDVPPNTLLIFVEPDAVPRTGPLAKALEAVGARVQFFPVLSGMPLVRWIKDRARTVGAGISDPAAELLATYAGGDLRVVANELDKLATYVGPGQPVDVSDVEALVGQVSEASIFDCVDAIGQGNRALALSSLHVLVEHGERPERILALVGRQVRLLLQAKDLTLRGEGPDGVGRALGLSPFPLRKILDQLRLFEVEQLETMLRRVLEADVQIKTGELESRLALELLIAELSAYARPRRAAPARPRTAPARGSWSRR
jgi:DNA polymerase-3 subunit delta